ncbi:hypothetical protein ABIB82_006508 [Bradyrhizobium sp. i1.8.4]
MDDLKRVLVFSEAGGTGRSYHAELSAKNQRLRVHYLLEPGWKADAAIQGLGRTNRTNQAQPPLFRPIATDVKAEKRFLSTIARRLDTLGAITRGQRQTGGQGLFRPEDNLESCYARDALRQLYLLIVRGKIDGCSLHRFESSTGLKLMDDNGIKDEHPPRHRRRSLRGLCRVAQSRKQTFLEGNRKGAEQDCRHARSQPSRPRDRASIWRSSVMPAHPLTSLPRLQTRQANWGSKPFRSRPGISTCSTFARLPRARHIAMSPARYMAGPSPSQ